MGAVEEARKEQELLRVRAAQQQFRASANPAMEATTRFFQGVNVGMEDVAGLPVDLTTAGINFLLGTPLEAGQRGKGGKTIGSELGIEPISKPFMGSQQIREVGSKLGFNYADISEVPENLRPIARAGEAVGGSIPAAAIPFASAARLGTKPASGMFRSFVEPARTQPARMAAVEASAAGGAGVGAAVAETLDPSSPLTRMGGELVGGILSPFTVFSSITGRLTTGLIDATRAGVSMLSPELAAKSATKGAARHVQGIVQTFGEDPQALAKVLRGQPAVEAPMTAGAKTQSLGLQALERKLIKDAHVFGIDIQRDLQKSIDNINYAFREAAGSGDPKALENLAKARMEYARVLVDTNIAMSERRIAEATESIVPARHGMDASRRAKELLLESYDDARFVEDELWGVIPKDSSLSADNLRTAYETEVTAGLLPGESVDLPGPVNAEIKRLSGKRPRLATSGDLLRLRSRILKEVRKEAGSQAPDRDRIYRLGLLQSAILDDLGGLPGTAEARAFSKDLNDRFTRGYVGKALSLDPRGGEKVPAGSVLEKGLRTGPEGLLASKDLERAASFTDIFPGEPKFSRFEEMRGLEGEMLRDLASSSIDPLTGQINPRALERFREANKEILANFPELDRAFSDAAATTSIYGRRIKRLMNTDKTLRQTSAFARMLGAEDPKRVVKAALNGPNPVADMDSIFLMARKDPQALEGARRIFLDTLYNESMVKVNLTGEETSMISGTKLLSLLDAGDGGVLQSALKTGVLTKGQVSRVRQIAAEAQKIESAMNFPGQLDKVVEDPSMLTDLLARVVGANVGSHSILAKTSGAQLVMAQYGSRLMRNLVEKLPAQNITKVLRAAARDPELMADLLTKPVGETQATKVAKRIANKLRSEGILYQVSEVWRPPVGPIGAAATEVPEVIEEHITIRPSERTGILRLREE